MGMFFLGKCLARFMVCSLFNTGFARPFCVDSCSGIGTGQESDEEGLASYFGQAVAHLVKKAFGDVVGENDLAVGFVVGHGGVKSFWGRDGGWKSGGKVKGWVSQENDIYTTATIFARTAALLVLLFLKNAQFTHTCRMVLLQLFFLRAGGRVPHRPIPANQQLRNSVTSWRECVWVWFATC